MTNILVTGGAGYVGSALVPALLKIGHKVTVYDLFLYGENVLQPHPNLATVCGDIRDISKFSEVVKGQEVVIHLACISNDPSFELDPKLGRSINLDAFNPMVECCKKNKVDRFIYASSSSVYGVKNEKNVTEDLDLEPLTDYSKFKAECEVLLEPYSAADFVTTVVRPATVCGVSQRLRLDVVVNILANHAYHNRKITVLGGEQLRPNIHIQDMVRVYLRLLSASPEKINGEIFNAGGDNMTVNDIARLAADLCPFPVEIVHKQTNDNRSYHISSDKIFQTLGFRLEASVSVALKELYEAFAAERFPNPLDNPLYSNIQTMKSLRLR